MLATPFRAVQPHRRGASSGTRSAQESLSEGVAWAILRAVVPRLNITLAVKRLIRDVAARLPEFAHVRASRMLVVAGEARRASRATIRPTRPSGRRNGPSVRVKGRTIFYVVSLRPLWFLESTPEERVATILHELYHASTRFDGRLHRGRRHAVLPLGRYNRKIRALTHRYLAEAPTDVVAPFAHRGVVRARMWLERPTGGVDPEGARRRVYTERQLFYGLVRMRTRGARR